MNWGLLKKLSPGDKLDPTKEDSSLQRLLDLDGEIMEVGGGYWVALRAKREPASSAKPHGVDYSLCLLDPDGQRLVCYDNAHPVSRGRGPGKKKSKAADHKHARTTIGVYDYTDAEALMQDFWTDVERVLKEEGVP